MVTQNLYEKEKELYLSTITDRCWDSSCNGVIRKLENPEVFVEDSVKYLRVAKCEKCGKGWSFWTFEQWVKNKRSGARKTIRYAKERKVDAKMEYNRAINTAKKQFLEKLEEIKNQVETAKKTLAEVV